MKTRLTHVTRHVPDAERALAFYRDLLGFQVRMDREFAPGQRWLTVCAPDQPDVEIVLLDPRGWFDGERLEGVMATLAAQPQIILGTDDIDATFTRLKAAGVPLDLPQVRQLPWGRDLLCRDPSGSSVNIVQSS